MCSSFALNYLSFSASFGFLRVRESSYGYTQTRFVLTSQYRFNTLLASGTGIITIIKMMQSQLAVGATATPRTRVTPTFSMT